MYTRIAVDRKTEQLSSGGRINQPQRTPSTNKPAVRTTQISKMTEIFLKDPDSVTREEFMLFQSTVGYRQAVRLMEEGKRRKNLKKAGQLGTDSKGTSVAASNSTYSPTNVSGKITLYNSRDGSKMEVDKDNTVLIDSMKRNGYLSYQPVEILQSEVISPEREIINNYRKKFIIDSTLEKLGPKDLREHWFNNVLTEGKISSKLYEIEGYERYYSNIVNGYGMWVDSHCKNPNAEVMKSIHTALDVFGFVPGIGDIADGANALIYVIEGDKINALLSAGAIIPLVGSSVFKGGKYAFKVTSKFDDMALKFGKIKKVKLEELSKVEKDAKVASKDVLGGGIDHSLDGVTIINRKYAGKTYKLSGDLAQKYPNGVKFTSEGFPDFSSYSNKTVKVNNLRGDTYYDFIKSNQAAGYKLIPKGFTWHHVEDGTTMMLVPADLHGAVRHTGGASLIKKGIRP